MIEEPPTGEEDLCEFTDHTFFWDTVLGKCVSVGPSAPPPDLESVREHWPGVGVSTRTAMGLAHSARRYAAVEPSTHRGGI